MQNWPRSSPASAPFRLEWRPSRWPVLALLILAPLGASCVLLSGVPAPLAWPLAVLAPVWTAWRARRLWRQPARDLVLAADGEAFLDGSRVRLVGVAWRGPLAVVHLVDGQDASRRLDWWPDTLPPAARRELRLAAQRGCVSRLTRAMAP